MFCHLNVSLIFLQISFLTDSTNYKFSDFIFVIKFLICVSWAVLNKTVTCFQQYNLFVAFWFPNFACFFHKIIVVKISGATQKKKHTFNQFFVSK